MHGVKSFEEDKLDYMCSLLSPLSLMKK